MNKVELKPNERLDDLHRNHYKIIQDPARFCFGMDAVLLTGFTQVKPGEEVIDLGTGTGVIPILLAAKSQGKRFIGLEIQVDSAEMAARSVQFNQLEHRVQIHNGDIKDIETLYKASSFQVVTSNPPYMNEGGGLVNPYDAKAIARHEVLCTLEDVIKGAARLLQVGGRFYMVHRPHRLVDIVLVLRQYKLEPKRMRLVYPYVYKEPNMVLIEAVKNGKPMIKMEKPLIIYKEDGTYTEEVYDIYNK